MHRKTLVASALSVLALSAAVVRAAFPDLKIDTTTALFLALAVVPWLGEFLRSLELPGGVKIEYQDARLVQAGVVAAGLSTSNSGASGTITSEDKNSERERSYTELIDRDPNLALAGLRIEIERALVDLGKRRGVHADRRSTLWIIKELISDGVLDSKAYLAIADLIHLLNKAVHGAEITPNAARIAMESGTQVLASIRSR